MYSVEEDSVAESFSIVTRIAESRCDTFIWIAMKEFLVTVPGIASRNVPTSLLSPISIQKKTKNKISINMMSYIVYKVKHTFSKQNRLTFR